MKKFLCAILFLTMVISLSACGGKGVSTLVKHYGQEKVDEMEIECTDETQLKVANDLIAEAKDIMSYCGSGDGTNKEDCGALERYYFFGMPFKLLYSNAERLVFIKIILSPIL